MKTMKLSNVVIGVLSGVIICLLFFNKCGSPEQPTNSNYIHSIDSLVDRIVELKDIQSELKDTVFYKEKIVYKWRDRYHETRHDSLIPCEEKLVICDTLIQADSSLIASQKEVIKIDSTIIDEQAKVIKIDSIEVKRLNKEVKKQKVIKVVTIITSAVVVGLLVVKTVLPR